ncbi:chemotaxis protein CheW [uncultured Clostridium sp.]|uniref:chemotaxis protein CheW n=1 Tax=uncultured Clostridium sp. TaxID=59620 RepID=UPI0026233A34|nr:chemotaxis protein CheW [uncultured Clostridium sp.]
MSYRKILIFNVQGKEYGVEISSVERIIGAEAISKIPDTEIFIEGVVDYRDSVLTVVSLSKLFNEYDKDDLEDYKIIVIFGGEDKIGLKVDSVDIVKSIDESNINSIPKIAIDNNNKKFKGVIKEDGIIKILIDGVEFLNYK